MRMFPSIDDPIYIITASSKLPKTWLSRLIEWYRQPNIVPLVVKRSSLFVFNWIMRIATLGLWFFFVEPLFKEKSRLLTLQNAAKQFDEDKSLDANQPPPDPICIKSETQTFNHINEYVIHDGMIWYRRRKGTYRVSADTGKAILEDKDGPWQRVYFDGALLGRKPVTLSADGANLHVLDDLGKVHYRKIILEGRGYTEIHRTPLFDESMSSHLGNFDLQSNNQDTYVAIDTTKHMLWSKYWYNLPILNPIINAIMGNLQLKGLLAHSHRGRFNDSYSDAEGRKHIANIGVTTTYECSSDRTEILKHDPWSPTWSKIRFYFPETQNHAFIATRIDSSASCIAALGYDINKKNAQGHLALWVNFCDIDILGGNPGLKYAYQAELSDAPQLNKNIRILPDLVEHEGWKKVGLPEEASQYYNRITVIQSRYDKRLIRLAAVHQDGTIGYFEKELNHTPTPWAFFPDAMLKGEKIIPKEQICNYRSKEPGPKECKGRIEIKTPIDVQLKHFGSHAYHSEIEITLENKIYRLGLHRRWGIKTFLGQDDLTHYELVIPKEIKNPGILGLFEGKRVIPVRVKENRKEHLIEIKP